MRRGLRTIHVAELDRVMAEAEAVRRVIASGAAWAAVHSCERVVGSTETPVWEIVLRVPRRRRRPR